MKTSQMIPGGIGLVVAATLTFNAQAAPCFDNNSNYQARVWHLEDGENTKYGVAQADGRICADEDRRGFVLVAFTVDETPYVGQISVGPNGLVTIEEDSTGYFLVSADQQGNQLIKVRMVHDEN